MEKGMRGRVGEVKSWREGGGEDGWEKYRRIQGEIWKQGRDRKSGKGDEGGRKGEGGKQR